MLTCSSKCQKGDEVRRGQSGKQNEMKKQWMALISPVLGFWGENMDKNCTLYMFYGVKLKSFEFWCFLVHWALDVSWMCAGRASQGRGCASCAHPQCISICRHPHLSCDLPGKNPVSEINVEKIIYVYC